MASLALGTKAQYNCVFVLELLSALGSKCYSLIASVLLSFSSISNMLRFGGDADFRVATASGKHCAASQCCCDGCQ